jgi:hypothetical protein
MGSCTIMLDEPVFIVLITYIFKKWCEFPVYVPEFIGSEKR